MKIFISLILFLSLNLLAEEKTKIKDLEFIKDSTSEKIRISFDGGNYSEPIMSFRKNMLQLEFPNTLVWPKIEKKFTLGEKSYDASMMAYQFDQNLVRFRAFFPYDVEAKGSKFTLVRELDVLYLEFPGAKAAASKTEELDEKYLAKLLIEKGDAKAVEPPVVEKVKEVQSSIPARPSNFSLAPFIGKFAGFLILVLLMFFALVGIFKKVMIRKGKNGFLNTMNTVEVLSTTYVGPKKNLVMVKVYKQILLLGVSDNGINFLTEIDSPIELLKSGEEHLTGNNFDKNLNKAGSQNMDFALKKDDEDLMERSFEEKKKEKVTDQIKKKLQQLKPLL